MKLEPVTRMGVRSVHIVSVVSLLLRRFTGIALSPASWSPPPGDPIPCLCLFIFVTFSTSLRVFALWVRSWLRVS